VPNEAAPAKVNLFLRVTGRREDGYHLLDSLAVFPAVGDLLTVAPGDGLSLAVEGPFATALAGEADNLVLRAARALAAAADIMPDARLRLDKRLPVASGIGGGSADAAAALRLLAGFWGRVLPGKELHAIAVALGADVPVCLAGRAARMAGAGELLGAAPNLPQFGLVLVNPGGAVATQAVFKARTGGFSSAAQLPPAWPDAASMAADLAGLGNDLQAAALTLHPPIGGALAALAAAPGQLLTRMSGSGATCFALFADAATARAAAVRLARPGWWVWGGEGNAALAGSPGAT
jgi:4-diphosphocytidyl-2-C-methyl-D-erythritol kinase